MPDAFIEPLRVVLDRPAPAPAGTLSELTLAVKDIIDLAGIPTGAGNPTYLDEARPALVSAPAVDRLLSEGTRVVGKAHTDEFAFSLSGTNFHYGTPRNAAAPGRIPGGSSSGSASAVAAGIADLALGTDTGGSVRVPASYCGLYGLRPTHGRVPLAGVLLLAPSFDTCGLLAADGVRLARAGRVLLGPIPDESAREPRSPASEGADSPPSSLRLATDLLAEADASVADVVRAGAQALATSLGIELTEGILSGARLPGWFTAFRGRQFVEVWQSHGEWLTTREALARPGIVGPGVAARLAAARDTPASAVDAGRTAREEVLQALDRFIPRGGALVLPSAATVAPPPVLDTNVKENLRLRTMRLTCVAGLSGAPAVSIPAVVADGALPVGICLVGRPGDDERLLAAAARWTEHQREAVTRCA